MRIATILCVALCFAGCNDNVPTAAKQADGDTATPGGKCEVTEGLNKGKKGTYDEDGDCTGDWGTTECKKLDGTSRCKDATSGGNGGDGSGGPLVGDIEQPGMEVINPVITILPPTSDNPSAVDYCKRDDSDLLVQFQNVGDMAGGGTVDVIVSFETSGGQVNVTQPRGPLEIDEIQTLRFEIPGQCFNPDCEFAVQWANANAVGGRCIG